MSILDPTILLRQAAEFHQHNEPEKAEPLYRKVLAIVPHQSAAHYFLGVLLADTGRFEEAISSLQTAVELSPSVSMYRNDLGRAFRGAGRLDEAIEILQSAIQLDANSVAAHANLGNALGDAGRFDEAVVGCRRAVELAPGVAAVHSDLGVALLQVNQFDQAIAAHEKALAVESQSSKFLNNYALALRAAGRKAEAEAACRRALEIDPTSTEAMNNLAVCRLDADDAESAIALLHTAIQLRPDYADAHNNLGNALCAAGQALDGEAEARRAIELRPKFAEAHNNLATALRDQGFSVEALTSCDTALSLDPRSSPAHVNRGACLADDARFEEAIAAYERAIALDPKSVAAHTNLATAFAALGLKDRCLAAARKAAELQPNHFPARANLALLLLTFGEFKEGWVEHECRWRANPKSRHRNFTQPQWDGSTLRGRTILLHAEQGFGDGIQFMRYAPLVAERGGAVLLEVASELHRLAKTVAGVSRVISYGDPLPPFELHCPLMSLPLAMGTELHTVPANVRYVHARPDLVRTWAERLSMLRGKRIGLVWAGRPSHSNDRNRSMAFDWLAPLFNVPGVSWVSLQRAPASAALRSSGWAGEVLDLGDELQDFADTAAVLANMDGLVSVDSSVAHLAGALGLPVWLMLPRVADWRWLVDRDDSPWYPQHRLVRQRSSGDWETVVQKVVEQLRQGV